MAKKFEYKAVTGSNTAEFNRLLKWAQGEGWFPAGSIALAVDIHSVWHSLLMGRVIDSDEEEEDTGGWSVT